MWRSGRAGGFSYLEKEEGRSSGISGKLEKNMETSLDQATQNHRSFGFVTFLERDGDAAVATAMDKMDGAELYGESSFINYALPERIESGEHGLVPNVISDLEAQCPALKTYRSCDLTSASWLSPLYFGNFQLSHRYSA